MKCGKINITAEPYITQTPCRKCHNYLKEVSNGLLDTVLFCPKCEIVYELKMIKIADKKISAEFLEQCRKESA